jgi:beta-glucosidase-like glycosyl hydrolase
VTRDEARRLVGGVFAVRFPRSWDEIDLERFPVTRYIVFRDVLGPTFEASRQRLADARTVLREHGLGQPALMMDEEGGRVTQTAEFFQSAPSARAVAKSLTPEEAGTLYLHLAAYLSDLGISINLAPCVDVNTEPMNPIIGTRAFGDNAEMVSLYAREAVAAMKKRVVCVAKHFPGHGMTRLDSHLALPVVEESRERLEAVHIAPFREAIRAHVDGVMVSHCRYPALQRDGLPASLSRAVVTDCLRRDLGFRGVVITDSLDMRAVTETVPPERAAQLALAAGCDLVLYTEISDRFEAAFEHLVDLAVKGVFGEQRFAESSDRMAMALFRGGLWAIAREALVRSGGRRPPDDPDLGGSQPNPSEFSTRTYLDLLYRARTTCTELIRGREKLPVSIGRAALIATTPGAATKLGAHVGDLVDLSAGADSAGPVPAGRDLLLWLTEPLFLKYSIDDLRALAARAPLAVLVTTYKQLAEEIEDADVAILADDTSQHAEDTIARLLFEKPPPGSCA